MRMLVRVAFVLLAAGLNATLASAEPTPPVVEGDRGRILLVAEFNEVTLSSRLKAELASMGYEVVEFSADDRDQGPTLLETAARQAGAAAALRVQPSRLGVEVWLSDRVSGTTLLREVVLLTDVAPGQAELVAVRAAEILRASLFKVAAMPARAEAPRPMPAAPEKPHPAVPRPAIVLAQVAAAYAASPGGLGPGFGVQPQIAFKIAPGWYAGVSVFVPVGSRSIETDGGSVKASVAMAEAVGEWTVIDEPFGVRIGLGLGAARLHVDGVAAAPNIGQSDTALSAYASGGATAFWPVGPIRLVLHTSVGVAFRRLVATAIDQPAGTWGRPVVSCGFGVEVPFR
jgi:hypothetical protein